MSTNKGEPAQRATRKDVARLAGTSTAVVSWSLNNGPRPVAPATKARVLAAVQELGYEPNLLARALKSNRTNTYGCIVPDSSNIYYSEIARSVERAAFDRGQVLLLGNGGYDLEHNASYLRTFSNLRVDGVIVVRPDPSTGNSGEHEAQLNLTLPVVYVHNTPPGTDTPAILPDMAEAGRLATKHLLAHGHSDVGVLAGQSTSGAIARAVEGWRTARTEAGLPRREELVYSSERGHYGAYNFAKQWLQQPDRPTALFAATDGLGVGVIRAASELGVRIPEDLAIVSCNGTDEAAFSYPTLTTAHHPIESIGRNAVELLESMIATPGNDSITSRNLPMELRLGESCGTHS